MAVKRKSGSRRPSVSTSELSERLARALADREISLGEERRQQLVRYAERLVTWGEKTNLVGPSILADPVPALVEALEPIAAGVPPPRRLLDIGSGGGLPAIPLALAWGAGTSLTLVEPRERRWAFLSLALRELGIPGEARRCGWEALVAPGDERWDAVSSRALGGQRAWLEALRGRLVPGARALLFLGGGQAGAELWNLGWLETESVRPLREPGHFLLVARLVP